MPTDTESSAREGSLDSSLAPNRGSNSGRSTRRSRRNSGTGQAGDAGEEAEPKVTSLDLLLSLLQSDLGEIRDRGVDVDFYSHSKGLVILIAGVAICQKHKQIHSGETCPHC